MDLLLSIVCSTLLYVVFKFFSKYKVDNFQAIIVNYFVAFSIGFYFSGNSDSFDYVTNQDWFYLIFIVGISFITIFNLMAISTQKVGVSITSVSNKMSAVIPILFAFILYQDKVTALKVGGVLLGLISIYLVSVKNGKLSFEKSLIYLPILIFLGSGMLDTIINYAEKIYLNNDEFNIFLFSVFLVSGMLGLVILLYKILFQRVEIKLRNFIGGVLLGVPNYFSIYFLLKALSNTNMDSSSSIAINNIGIVLLSSVLGFFFFKEKFQYINWIGIGVAVLSIILISF